MATSSHPNADRIPSVSQKRKTSMHDGEGRIVKHRASKACKSCRTRKVRCDVSAKGSRCTNCELDDLECVVLPSRRGQSHRTSRRDPAATTKLPPTRALVGKRTSKTGRINPIGAFDARRASPMAEDRSQVPAVVTFDEEGDNEQEPHVPASATDHASAETFEPPLTPETGMNPPPQQHSPASTWSLPSFLAPIPAHLLPEDLEFLRRKGALAIPEPDLRIEILRAYLFSVHPFMPMLDVRSVAGAVLAEDGQVSLLLFQAVMFAGLHSLQHTVVERLGFQSPKQAREVFFDRVRLLYDFNVETDNAAILQSLILMSSWYSKQSPWNERRHTWHWTGLAYDLARTMGLHREPSRRFGSDHTRRFRRRLWWSLYIRDRMIALGTRRPMRITDDEFDVSMLALDDFELDAMDSSAQVATILPSTEESTCTALMCIELVKLCVCVGRVVSSQYTTLGDRAGAPRSMMIMPRRDERGTTQLESCEKELQEWIKMLASNTRRSDDSIAWKDPRSCSEVHWAQLNITYLTVVNVLHRAQALQPDSGHRGQPSSKSKVKDAARGITRMGQDMLRQDQVRFLGLIGVTALLAACLTHMLDIGSGDEDVRDASTFRLYQSLQVLEALREIYASADSAVTFLSSVTRKAGITLPFHPTASTPAPGVTTKSSDSPSGVVKTRFHQAPLNTHVSFPGVPFDTSSEHWQKQSWADPPNNVTSTMNVSGLEALCGWRGQSANVEGLPHSSGMFESKNFVGRSSPRPDTSTRSLSTSAVRPSQGMPQNSGSGFSGFSDAVPDNASLSWNNGLDSGVDLGPMSFNYDFFSDAFGFLDSDMQWM